MENKKTDILRTGESKVILRKMMDIEKQMELVIKLFKKQQKFNKDIVEAIK